jgi:hypothetical protein
MNNLFRADSFRFSKENVGGKPCRRKTSWPTFLKKIGLQVFIDVYMIFPVSNKINMHQDFSSPVAFKVNGKCLHNYFTGKIVVMDRPLCRYIRRLDVTAKYYLILLRNILP